MLFKVKIKVQYVSSKNPESSPSWAQTFSPGPSVCRRVLCVLEHRPLGGREAWGPENVYAARAVKRNGAAAGGRWGVQGRTSYFITGDSQSCLYVHGNGRGGRGKFISQERGHNFSSEVLTRARGQRGSEQLVGAE